MLDKDSPAPITWQPKPKQYQLANDALDLWCAWIPQSSTAIRAYQSYLSPTEQQRAARFCFVSDQQRYQYSRGVLRCLLATYLGIAPSDVPLGCTVYGKPYLDIPSPPLHFNVSHSQDCVLYAVTRQHPVGIDVEYKRSIDAFSLAKRFFSSDEYQQLCQTPKPLQQQFFYDLWALKEAFIKAIGLGLSFSLAQFTIELTLQQATLKQVSDPRYDIHAWQLHYFQPQHHYRAAVAMNSFIRDIHYWQWL